MRLSFYTFCFLSVFWISCANVVAPTGGAKDTKAPKLIHRSLPDSALQFKGGKIVFEFNEFLQIKDADNQIIITPLLSAKPKIDVHKKKVSINMHDSLLLPNTTYQVQMGTAIQDLHEGNPVNNFSFIFSTGKYFDSLQLKGKVFQANTGKYDTSCIVVLYDTDKEDSIVCKKKPLYVTRTINGNFLFKNMPNKKFKIYAIGDFNKNLQWDPKDETIAFVTNDISTIDTTQYVVLYTYRESLKNDSSSKSRFEKNARNATLKDNIFTYTINVDTAAKNANNFHLNDSIRVVFSDSIQEYDISKILLKQGDAIDATVTINKGTDNKSIILYTQWLPNSEYKLLLEKSFAKSKNGIAAIGNTFNFKTKKESDYGYLRVVVKDNKQKVLLLHKDNMLYAQKACKDTVETIERLLPGNYELSILEDINENGRWDTGNFGNKKYPEIVTYIQEPIQIKANWGFTLRPDEKSQKDLKLKSIESK